MSNCIDKKILDSITCDITVLDFNLEYWLKNKNDSQLKIFDNREFLNFEIENVFLLTDQECEVLAEFDNCVSREMLSFAFEKQVLLKRKDMLLKDLDLQTAIDVSKKIDGIDQRVVLFRDATKDKLNNYTDLIKNRLLIYNKFVAELENGKELRDLYKCNEYDSIVVSYYRFNKICDYLMETIKSNNVDFNILFDSEDIKNLLSYDYLRVKQKVGALCGNKL